VGAPWFCDVFLILGMEAGGNEEWLERAVCGGVERLGGESKERSTW
jgi:hypothetical protein